MFNRRNAAHKIIILLFLCPVLFLSCSKKAAEYITFDDGWAWAAPYFQNIEFIPVSTTTLHNISKLVPERKGYVWLQNFFTVPADLQDKELGLYIGNVEIACSIHINGIEIGKCGVFPPDEFSQGTGASYFHIPQSCLRMTGTNELIIKVWCNGGGNIRGMPFIGLYDDVYITARKFSYTHSTMNLVFSDAIILIGFFYLFLFIRRTSEKEYLYYSLMCFVSSVYLFPFCISELPWLIGVGTLLSFRKLTMGIAAFIDVYLATSFIRVFLKFEDSIYVKVVRIALLLAALINTVTLQDLRTFSLLLPVIFGFAFFQLSFGIWAVIQALIEKRKEVILLLIGFAPVIVCVFIDLFVHVVFVMTTMPFFTIYGWQASITAFLLILAERYTQARRQAEFLSEKLEIEVNQRTKELAEANKKLEYEHTQTVRDMDLATHVQRSFYPQEVSVKNGWEIAVYFKPLSGVSGDLYDFYIFDDKLSGLGLFDVSGHGIAAGLVTMLAKNIIFNTYRDNIKKHMNDIMVKINDNIIHAKGSIENYLTGAMIRMSDIAGQDGMLELVNAGNPPPLLHRTGTDSAIAITPERSKLQCGMIGIAGLDVHFQTVEFGMNENDSLLFYTDGITEAQNLSGQDYGLQRLKYSFAHAESGSAEKKLASVLRDFMIFVDDAPLKDDITIIVLKRSAKSEKVYQAPLATAKHSDTAENAGKIEEAEELEELEELEEVDE